jgi:hypothetical protein
MATAQRGIFPKQMDRDIVDMYMDRLASRYSEYERCAKQEDFPKGKEYRAAEITGIGDVEQISEGGRPAFDVPAEGNEKGVEATKYGLGFMITEEMLDDDFHGKIKQVSGTLADAAVDYVNQLFFSLFNDGNDTHTSWDGEYIFSNSHTTLKSGDTIDNLAAGALTETTLQAAFEYFDDLVDGAGRKTMIEGDHLMVPVNLRWMGNRLLRQMGGITTETSENPPMGGNDMTTNPSNGYVNGWDLGIYKYLTNDTFWYFISKKEHDMRLLWKKRITLQSTDDWQTDTRMYKVTFRTKAAAFDYKGVYGYLT